MKNINILVVLPKLKHRSIADTHYFTKHFFKKETFAPPMFVSLIKALTPKNIQVDFIDENINPVNFNKNYDLVVFTATTSIINRAIFLSYKFNKKGIKTILGGIHAHIESEKVKHFFTSIAIGEIEILWKKIIIDLKKGTLKKIYTSKKLFNLANSPIPKWDGINLKKYIHFPIQTSRGCPFDCEFCSVSIVAGRKIRHRKIKSIIQEIKKYVIPLNLNIFFVDDNLIGDKSFAIKLFKELKKLKVKWTGQASINIGKDIEYLKLIKESGCNSLFIGFESIFPETLQAMNKKVNLNNIVNFKEYISNIFKSGIDIYASFIFGNRFDSPQNYIDLAEFIKDSKLYRVVFNFLTPFPGTKLFNKLKKEHLSLPDNFNNYDFLHPLLPTKYISKPNLIKEYQLIHNNIYNYSELYTRSKYILENYNLNNFDKNKIKKRELCYYLFKGITYCFSIYNLKKNFFTIKMLLLFFNKKITYKKNILFYLVIGIDMNNFTKDIKKRLTNI